MSNRIASEVSAGDVSHDGGRIAAFQLRGADVELVTISRDGIVPSEIKRFREGFELEKFVSCRSVSSGRERG